MNNMRTAPIVLASLILTSCSSLRVEVSIADPSVARLALDQQLLRDQLPRVRAETNVEIGQLLERMTEQHHAIWQQLRAHYVDLANAATATPDQKEFYSSLAEKFNDDAFEAVARVYKERQQALAAIPDEVRTLCPLATGCPDSALDRVTALLREREALIRDVRAYQHDDLARTANDPNTPASIRGAAQQLDATTQSDLTSLIGGAGLQSSQEAYAVVSAPDTKWQPRFDLSKALGSLGDMNVAVKMERRGNFTIKGVSFDPSEVTRAIAKMGTQLVLALTQSAGVSVTAASGTTPPAGLATSSNALATTNVSVETSLAQAADRRDALLTIADAIAREKDNIDGTDAQRKAAIAAINATYQAHKTRISEPTTK